MTIQTTHDSGPCHNKNAAGIGSGSHGSHRSNERYNGRRRAGLHGIIGPIAAAASSSAGTIQKGGRTPIRAVGSGPVGETMPAVSHRETAATSHGTRRASPA